MHCDHVLRAFLVFLKNLLLTEFEGRTYILLTKHEGRTGRISARGLDSTDLAALGPYKKDRGPIFSQYGPEQEGEVNFACVVMRAGTR